MDPGDCKAVRADAVTGVLLPDMDADEPAWLSFVISRYLDEAGSWKSRIASTRRTSVICGVW